LVIPVDRWPLRPLAAIHVAAAIALALVAHSALRRSGAAAGPFRVRHVLLTLAFRLVASGVLRLVPVLLTLVFLLIHIGDPPVRNWQRECRVL
jgi:hypothetical protein